MEVIQRIVDLRKSAPVLPVHIESMKKIEPFLNTKEMGGWRNSGPPQRGPPQRGRPQQTPWKTTAHASPKENSAAGEAAAAAAAAAPAAAVTITVRPPPFKYESKFHPAADVPVETTILNSILLNKLNKFSPGTYTEVRDFIYQIIDKGESDFIKNFMRLVFTKAIAEEIYCPLYAKLLSELRSTYPVIQTEMLELFHSYMAIFDTLTPDVASNTADYQTFVKNSIEKKHRLGYSQFLSELVLLDAVDINILKQTFEVLIQNIYTQGQTPDAANEILEYTDCLLRMTRPFLKRTADVRAMLYEIVQLKLEKILAESQNYPSLLPKSRFALMDIQENLHQG